MALFLSSRKGDINGAKNLHPKNGPPLSRLSAVYGESLILSGMVESGFSQKGHFGGFFS